MRRLALRAAGLVVMVGPFVLSFFAGGYFATPRITAALVAWIVVIVCALAAPRPLPRRGPAWLALAGLVALTALTLASLAWAPRAGPVLDETERLALYTAVLLTAMAALRESQVRRAVEPILAGGIVVVIGYGLAARLLPGLIHQAADTLSRGRLNEPLTYWNALGALAAIGWVLSVRIAGDDTRQLSLRALAAATTPVLLLGCYLTYSRGALAAGAAGLVVLVAAAPNRSQARAAVIALVTSCAAIGTTALWPAVTSTTAAATTRQTHGAATLVAVALLATTGGAVGWLLARREARSGPRRGRFLPRWAGAVAAALVVLIVAGVTALSLVERDRTADAGAPDAGAARLTSLGSNRYAYWRVALDAFADHPFAGAGAGAFQVAWLRERPLRESVKQAHSLELQTLADLGVVGAVALLCLFAGLWLCARRALRLRPQLVAGWCAALTVFAVHSAIDWDWQMPALAAVALILAGALAGVADEFEPGVAPTASTAPGAARREPRRSAFPRA